jgi:protein TonB
MSKYLLFAFTLALQTVNLSQPEIPTRAKDDSTYFIAVEVMPEPIGGIAAIQSNLYYSKDALKNEIEGKVYVLTYVNEKGTVDKTMVIKGLGYGLDEIASEGVLQAEFKPGMLDGIPVKVEVVIPILFKLE